MSSNTGSNCLNWITLPFEWVPFYGPSLLFDINFVTPGSQEVLCSVSVIRLKLWLATFIIKFFYEKTNYSEKKWNNRGLLK